MPPDTEIAMTYAELARRLKIKPASAKRLAQRNKWKRVVGNDRVALVHVPMTAVPSDATPNVAPDSTNDVIHDVPDDVAPDASPSVSSDLAPRIAHLEGLLEGMQGQLEAERRRADAAEARVADIAADREAWKLQAQRSFWSRLTGR